MLKVDEYRLHLRSLGDWTPYLLKYSGLPGPRGNLELAQAFAEEASDAQVEVFFAIPVEEAPENSAQVFLVFCGVTALGKRLASGDHTQFARLRILASDARWRVREAVAIALHYAGSADLELILREMEVWCKGNWYDKRAAAAALVEPRLLRDRKSAKAVLRFMDLITESMAASEERRSDAFKTLRKSMGYCWSVAIAAFPEDGKALFERWLSRRDPDIRWIVK